VTGRHLASGAKDHSNVVKGDEVEAVLHDELQRYEEDKVKEGEEGGRGRQEGEDIVVAKEPKAQAVETAEPVKSKE